MAMAMALGPYETALGWLGSENRKSSIRVFSTITSYAPVCLMYDYGFHTGKLRLRFTTRN
jgi:hypothetical protein